MATLEMRGRGRARRGNRPGPPHAARTTHAGEDCLRQR